MGWLIMTLPILGESISRVAFDYGVTLLTDGGSELRIETSFSIASHDRPAVVVEPAEVGDNANALVDLLGSQVDLADTWSDGSLRLRLSGGQMIEVPPHPEFEAWTFAGSGGVKALATPGGGLTTWGLE